MPYTTLSSGLTVKVPTRGTVNWAATLLAENFQKISEHDHTGSGKGTKITQSALNLAAGSTRAMPPLISQVQDGSVLHGGTSGGTANAQTITLAPAITAIIKGMLIRFEAGATNTGAATLNVNGIGATPLKKLLGGKAYPLTQGDIVAGRDCEVLCDGTNFILMNPSGPSVVARQGTVVSVSNSTTVTTIITFTLLANSLGPYGRLRGGFNGRFVNNSGVTVTYLANLTIGGNGICAVSNSVPTLTSYLVKGHFDVAARDSTASQSGGMIMITGSTAGANTATLTKDTTADQTVSLVLGMSSAQPSASFDIWDSFIEMI